MRASLSPESIWGSGWPRESLSVGDRCSLFSPLPPPPRPPPRPPSPSTRHDQPFPPIHLFRSQTRGMSGCARATPSAWPLLYYPTQDKRVFREAGCLPKGDTMPWGWQACGLGAVDHVPALCEWASGGICCVCVCVCLTWGIMPDEGAWDKEYDVCERERRRGGGGGGGTKNNWMYYN